MKSFLISLFSILVISSIHAQFVVSEVGTLPERVSNNAVCEGFIEGTPYLFSFGGIDSTRSFSGIHLRSFRYNIETGESERIADLPDALGKIAAAASRIGNVIYIAGGYNVFANSTENTTHKMHRYDIKNNQFLSDAKDIPTPTDDHVQAVWRDSLIYLITGWNQTANIPNVQIYDPSSDEWAMGTKVPNLDTYKSFGASGVIIGDVIYYFGGARSTGNFNIQNQLRIGVINPDSPTEIEWTITIPDLLVNGYRMAATSVKGDLHWLGGSNKTYNYNGIAYDGSGIVSPNKRDLWLIIPNLIWFPQNPFEIPMDLRGIADVSDQVKYIAGGMLDDREVTNKIFKLEWNPTSVIENEEDNITVMPNPFQNQIEVKSNNLFNTIHQIDCFDLNGNLVITKFPNKDLVLISTAHLPVGMYILQIKMGTHIYTKKIIKSIN